MYKIVRMLNRRKDLTPAQFKDIALKRHTALGARAIAMAPIRKIVANFATGESFGGAAPPFDGMLEVYFDKLGDVKEVLEGPVPGMVREGERDFLDLERSQAHTLTEEFLMSQKPDAEKTMKSAGQIKIVRTVYRRKDLTLQQFKDYWLTNHSKLEDRVIRESPVTRIVATFAVPEPGKAPDFDGMVELYFNRVDDIRAMFSGPIPAMMRSDEENFVQMDAPAIRVVAEEHLLAQRAAAKVA